MKIKNLLLFIFFLGCEDKNNDEQRIDDGGVVVDTWGQITSEIPRVYSATDVSQSIIDLTLDWYKIGADAWGNYDPEKKIKELGIELLNMTI